MNFLLFQTIMEDRMEDIIQLLQRILRTGFGTSSMMILFNKFQNPESLLKRPTYFFTKECE
jgi:hypothetical protein